MTLDNAGFTGDIFVRLAAEHRQILDLLERARRDPVFLVDLVVAIRIHDRAEDQVVFKVLDGSYELGKHMHVDHEDHAAIEMVLRLLQPGDDLTALHDLLIRHFADEENLVFPDAHMVISSPHAAELLHTYELEREYLLARY